MYEELGRKDQNKREAEPPPLLSRRSIFHLREKYFLDQLPHLTAIVVIFENAQLAARARALEAVDQVTELEYIMAFAKDKPAGAISRDAFASAVESRDSEDDVIRADQDGGRRECQRHA